MGCGKSTISKVLAEKLDANIFSVDDVLSENNLEQFEGGYIAEDNFIKANDFISHYAKIDLKKGNSVIIDGNFYFKSQVEDLIQKLDCENSSCYVFTLDLPLNVCVQRDKNRAVSLGEVAVKEVYAKSTEFSYGRIIDVGGSLEDAVSEILSYLSKP